MQARSGSDSGQHFGTGLHVCTSSCPTHLQDEDEIVHGLVPVEEVVLRRPLVLLVVLQLLDDVRVLQQAQQDLLRHLHGRKRLHLWGEKGNRQARNLKQELYLPTGC